MLGQLLWVIVSAACVRAPYDFDMLTLRWGILMLTVWRTCGGGVHSLCSFRHSNRIT